MSHPVCKLLGKHLIRLTNGQKELTVDLVAHGGTLALFFTENSSVEDKQMQNFSSRLMDFHREMNKRGIAFEVIQIPLDEHPEKKSSLFPQNELTFLAIGEEHSRNIQEYLIQKYGIQRPTVILIDSTSANVINFQGKEKILEDPTGTHFPWRFPECSEILASGHLIRACSNSSDSSTTKHQIVNFSQIKGCIKGLYFGAFWCPPCKSFLALLIDVYKKINADKKKFEIIFISSDRSNESFDRFLSTQPWLAIPYEDKQRRDDLTFKYNIQGIPALIIIDSNDNIITLDGRSEIIDDTEAVDFPWYPKLVDELRDNHSTILSNTLCLIYFLGQDENEFDRAESILSVIATEIAESEIEEALQPRFFIATDCELSESLKIFMDLDESSSHIVAIHKTKYSVSTEKQKNEQTIRDFLHKFQASHSKLDYRSISIDGFIFANMRKDNIFSDELGNQFPYGLRGGINIVTMAQTQELISKMRAITLSKEERIANIETPISLEKEILQDEMSTKEAEIDILKLEIDSKKKAIDVLMLEIEGKQKLIKEKVDEKTRKKEQIVNLEIRRLEPEIRKELEVLRKEVGLNKKWLEDQ